MVEQTQDIDDFNKSLGKNAAFKSWVNKLHENDTKPRGRFFRNYKKKFIVIDEAWQGMSNPTPLNFPFHRYKG